MTMPEDFQRWRSWVESANDPATGWPLQLLPYCSFLSRDHADDTPHLGVGIGSLILDLKLASQSGVLFPLGTETRAACTESDLNALMRCGPLAWSALRKLLITLLREENADRHRRVVESLLFPKTQAYFFKPVAVPNYTDFYASIHHATNVGRLFRPDQPLLPNYKWVPVGYHGRASSIVISGTEIRRPNGQIQIAKTATPIFAASTELDYELEVGAYIGVNNPLGTPIDVNDAEAHIFGLTLLNDWSARDIQSWEYQPLGPFLGKSFATSVSPWVIPIEALDPYRCRLETSPLGDPDPLPYLAHATSAFDVQLEAWISTASMRQTSRPAVRLSESNLSYLYWDFSQLVAHHTSNGCNLEVGDLLASGTISGSLPGSLGCLMELTARGAYPLILPDDEVRTFLEDGDEIILRAFCEREGLPPLALGECRGTVIPANSSPYIYTRTTVQPVTESPLPVASDPELSPAEPPQENAMATLVETPFETPVTPTDFLPLNGTDYVEFYVGNARQSAYFYRAAFGMKLVAYSGPETGQRDRASYVLQQGKVRFVLTTALRADSEIARHVQKHGDGVRAIALWVDDAADAWLQTTRRGASSVCEPHESSDEHGSVVTASIAAYGDTLHTFVERRNYSGVFLPGYREMPEDTVARPVGLLHVDHIVGNVGWNAMNEWVDFYSHVMGFSLYQHFDDNDISTEYSALMSKVMANATGYVKFPINEPAEGRRKSQIEEYLDFYDGPGVQHIALATHDILATVSQLQEQGVTFLTVPHSYYTDLQQRIGKIDEPIEELERSASSSTATTKATCSRSSPAPSKTAPPSSTKSSSARAAAASARATSKPSSKPSNANKPNAATSNAVGTNEGRHSESGAQRSRRIPAFALVRPPRPSGE